MIMQVRVGISVARACRHSDAMERQNTIRGINPADTHHLHQLSGSATSSARPTVATKAKGQANSIQKAARDRRNGSSVTVIRAIWKGKTE